MRKKNGKVRKPSRWRILLELVLISVACMILCIRYPQVLNDSQYRATLTIGAIAAGTVVLYLLIKLVFWYWKRYRYLHSTLYEIDCMTGEAFEDYLYMLFKKQGYKVDITPQSSDYGADLILVKNKAVTVVQAKRYRANVGVEAVQQIVGAVRYYHADYAMVVTNSYFTANAVKLAEANDVMLWDRDVLAGMR